MDIVFRIMDNENDVTLTDGKGIVLRVSDSYEDHYDVDKEDVIGRSVYELEEQEIFKPSVTVEVLKEKKKVTLMQTNKKGEKVLTTGVPILDELGEIEYVISFNSIDIANVTTLHDNYSKLTELMEEYSAEIHHLKMKELEEKSLIAKSKEMSDINDLILQIAEVDANVLITGETGVGKSMVAKMLHQTSSRSGGPFIEINCGTIPPTLIESELFGYEKGAFTGANHKGKLGKIELANGGTLFLDEIGELPLEMQIKILQVIQQKVISRIGSLEKMTVDFRLVAATNKDLEKAIKRGEFREDLYYRLSVIDIYIPPLRERRDDIIPLILNFVEKFNARYHKDLSVSSKALIALEGYEWPGNIRQVENFIERMVITFKGKTVEAEDLPKEFQTGQRKNVNLGDSSLSRMLEEYEKEIFLGALEKYKTSVAVGRALGISQTTAARKLRKYVPDYTYRKPDDNQK
ncbi:sigma 54-interacting transcriptional regulator [Anaerovorax odorimutans]|uniref:HTH-type transcriptional regulatory protein TyrR n=1 Tax=Anaerovorax odorimutans TaxID=109327 RepID=A0ABT1RPU5_9FIRM|nr:sigma 54-interacting transcriptional regulator [Anaerovorax odorimutans]MCQ4636896.1 sigma 54-interacting transcriptional regulator [Anaerovorax odorimutans]